MNVPRAGRSGGGDKISKNVCVCVRVVERDTAYIIVPNNRHNFTQQHQEINKHRNFRL
jgi:hypothetical protein